MCTELHLVVTKLARNRIYVLHLGLRNLNTEERFKFNSDLETCVAELKESLSAQHQELTIEHIANTVKKKYSILACFVSKKITSIKSILQKISEQESCKLMFKRVLINDFILEVDQRLKLENLKANVCEHFMKLCE